MIPPGTPLTYEAIPDICQYGRYFYWQYNIIVNKNKFVTILTETSVQAWR
jgi:hypothetical protein